jgi:mono/diheme cytochrome c family protein
MFGKQLAAITGKLLPESRATRMAWLVAVLASAALLTLPEIVRLDGKPHADWQQFLGRFHPLAVHLPIGLIVLLPLLEIAGAFRPALREAAGFVLGLACAACLGTLILGFLLAYGSGDAGTTVTRHLWGGIALCIGLFLCLLARSSESTGSAARGYPALLVCVLLVLLFTAHQGGSLTHGSNYLTEYLPAPLKRWAMLGAVSAAVPNSDSFYGKHIHPIFDSNCVACHGPGKMQGGLRLDSYESLMRGGKDGPVVLPRSSDTSLLIERVTLPANNQHFMPAEGRPSLKPDQIAWIRAWIQQGASPTAINVAGISIPEGSKELPIQPVGDYSSLMDEIRQMQQSQSAKLLPVSGKPSDGLILNTVDVAPSFGDAQLAQFQRFAPYIVEADLARTAVTDASFDILSRFTHLRVLHLEGTAVTGSGLAKLTALSQLTYLNLSETKITTPAVAPLKSMPNLHHVYLFSSPAEPELTTERSAQ